MKRSKRMTMKKKKAKFGTQWKWLESKRKKAGKQLNQELNMQIAKAIDFSRSYVTICLQKEGIKYRKRGHYENKFRT